MGRWEEVAHTADLAVHVSGDTLADLFSAAGAGMTAMLGVTASGVGGAVRYIALAAQDVEALLVDWLNELLYLGDSTGRLFTSYEFDTLCETSLVARVEGYPVAQPWAHIKAATYNDLVVSHGPDGFEATIVFDV
jgi:SHS2 domain-containing protein